MDLADEKANTLSRCGSFYYNTLVDESKDDAEFISHVPWVSKFPAQLQNLVTAVVGKSHFSDFYRVIKFTDADVDWRGLKGALQIRTSVPAKYPALPDYNNRLPDYELGTGAMLQTSTGSVVANETEHVLLTTDETSASLPGDVQLFWNLRVDPSVYVTSIRTKDGKLWFAGQEYTAQYGKLTFSENPIKLFPDMEFMAESCIVRKPHIYNHMLRLGSVYETPDRVLHYYRQSQTPKTFYLAAAQACGLAVIRRNCTIVNRTPMFNGYSYSTTDGIYEAPYKHTALNLGTSLAESYVIGGQELFQLCSPGTPLPPNVTRLNLDNALPIPGLSATNDTIQIWNENGQYRPEYSGDRDAVEAWHAFLQGVRNDADATGGTGRTNIFRPTSGDVLQPIVQQAIVANAYDTGEACYMYFTILSASGSNTYPLLRLADDYFLITQGGQYIGLSSSADSMKNAEGADPGWAPSHVEQDDFGFDFNAFESDTRIYGWISRNAAGATGQANALPIPGMVIDIQYKMSSANPDGLYMEMHDSAYTVSEVVRMDMGVLDLHKIDTGNITVRVSSIASKDTMVLPVSAPGIAHFRDVACKDRCLVACINEAYMSTEMQLRLMEFLRRELPTGAVLVTADLPTVITDGVQPEPEPVVTQGTMTSTAFNRAAYHAAVLCISESAGVMAWQPELSPTADTKLRSVTIRCATNANSSTGTTNSVRIAVYQADEGRFIGVSNVAHTWQQATKKKFTFDTDLPVKLTDRLMFVYVTPEATIEELTNPTMSGLDVGEDNLTLSTWRTEVREDTYPVGWGVIASTTLANPDRAYMYDMELELVQQV